MPHATRVLLVKCCLGAAVAVRYVYLPTEGNCTGFVWRIVETERVKLTGALNCGN